MLRLLSCLALLLVLTFPGKAAAAGCKAPAGTSGVDQYCEVIPGAKGDKAPPRPGGPGGGAISDSTAAALAAQGKAGQALDRALGKDPTLLAGAGKRSLGDRRGVRHSAKGSVELPEVPSSNPLNAVKRAVSGTTTLDSPFFLALFAVVLAVLGWAWVAYRRRTS